MVSNNRGSGKDKRAAPISVPLLEACVDLIYLYKRGYPAKRAAELAGNRYRLSAMQRSILRRGTSAPEAVKKRGEKLVQPDEITGKLLSVDGCNVLAILGNYLSGYFVYIAADGIVRDAAESSGVFRNSGHRRLSVELVCEALSVLNPSGVQFFIDEPHAHSRDLAGEVSRQFGAAGIDFRVELVRSADRVLKSAPGILATGDSEIIDAVEQVFDLSRFVLESVLGTELRNLNLEIKSFQGPKQSYLP